MPGPQSGHDQLLLGAGGRGFFQYPLDAIQTAAAGDGRAADGPVVAEHALAGGLHGGDRTVFRPGRLDQLLRAAPRLAADVEVVAHQVQEGLPADQRGRAMQGLAITAGAGLFDEDQQPRVVAGRFAIDLLAAAADDDAHLLDAGGDDLFEDDLQGRLFHAVQIDEALQRQAVLVRPGRGDHGFANFHAWIPGKVVTNSNCERHHRAGAPVCGSRWSDDWLLARRQTLAPRPSAHH